MNKIIFLDTVFYCDTVSWTTDKAVRQVVRKVRFRLGMQFHVVLLFSSPFSIATDSRVKRRTQILPCIITGDMVNVL